MNLFRSEEHVKSWEGFKPGTEAGMLPLAGLAQVFSGNFFTRRMDPDYIAHYGEYLTELVGTLGGLGLGEFWEMPAP